MSAPFAIDHDDAAHGRVARDRALLARLDRRDASDREALVRRFLPLAADVARRYQRRDEPADDIFQVACLGLVKAIDRFDPECGAAFSSYAMPTMAGEIKRYYRDRTWAVRVPRDVHDLAMKAERTTARLALRLGRAPTMRELCTAVGADEPTVREAMRAAGARTAASFDAPAEDEGPDRLADRVGGAEAGYEHAEARATLAPLLALLSAREREIMRLRFEEDLTQAEVGEQVGLSQVQVSRLIRAALERLRAASSLPPAAAEVSG